MNADYTPAEPAETDIAIVAMSGRFPGAGDVDELWRRVAAAEDCLVELDAAALEAAGVPSHIVRSPDYVARNGVLDDVEMFDAGFFGVGPRDASIMDPQHRHFAECAWDALETCGHVPERFAGAIGVFAGCGMNTYMLNNLLTNQTLVDQVGMFLLRHTANDKDFFTTTVSYKLDLRGPSVNVQTACSTSLVAVHLAVQSLLAMECDLALAGGATIEVPHFRGYVYQEGEILAPDGVCRAFDERSGGTVLTSGVGVVALRRLGDAIADGDPVLAVIRGTAVNNDGQRKVGYLAPSVDGHADVIKEALGVAGLSARDLQLFEAHGTGTAVGDPIEFAAATEAFRASTADTQFCRIVSTKPNIGHLDTAAGVASLIKVVQAMQHRTLPPLANHTGPSPLLDLERSPFVISGSASSWPGDRPRRAGVSSLGVGGTNAHVIVEEPPELAVTPAAAPEQLLVLSARESDTVTTAATRLADHLAANRQLNLADVAHTLAAGRRRFEHRRVVVATGLDAAIETLRSTDRNRVASQQALAEPPRVVFMFPGGGSQYAGMAAGLDERFDVFHQVLADGIAGLHQRTGIDLAPLLRADADPTALRPPTVSLPAVFLTSLALARQWMAWGVTPEAFVGHSLGEYAAAHLAGVLTFDGALDLVVARAALMERSTGSGTAMMAVPLPADDVRTMLTGTVDVATINADDECVVAGLADDVITLQAQLTDQGLTPTLIPLAAAAHSRLLDPVLPEFLDAVQRVELSPPVAPYTSNLSGGWIDADEATSPQYWVDHLRGTVRFSENLATALADGPAVFVELGPGHALSSYARRQVVKPVAAIPSLRHPNQAIDDTAASLLAIGRLWATGVDVDIGQFTGSGRRTVRLPGYPFRRERHWIEPGARALAESVSAPVAASAVSAPATVPQVGRPTDIADMFWEPRWIERAVGEAATDPAGPWLIVGGHSDELVATLERALVASGSTVQVAAAPSDELLAAARAVVVVGASNGFEEAAHTWLDTAVAAVRMLGDSADPTLFAAVTRGAMPADGPASLPVDALALGVAGVGSHEYPTMRTMMIDLDSTVDADTGAAAILAELRGNSEPLVAWRGGRRLVPDLDRLRVDEQLATPPSIRQDGNYLVTGGLGGVGFEIARHLAARHGANLAVVASRPVPEGAARSDWLAHHGYDDPTSRRIRRLAELESLGTKVTVVVADLADERDVAVALDQVEAKLGRLDGAVHAAGELRDHPIALATAADTSAVLGAKAGGALALTRELSRRGAELLVLISSTSTALMTEGQTAYVAANAVLDSLAGQRGALRVVTLNYGVWAETGIAAKAALRARLAIGIGQPIDHPVLSELAVERDGTVHATGTLHTQYHWLVDEHRNSTGVAVLPGTGHLELLLATLAASGHNSVVIGPLTFLDPLVVPDGAAVMVRITLRSAGDHFEAEIDSDGGVGRWRTHSEATVRDVPVDDPPLLGRLDLQSDVVEFDPLARPRTHLDLGPRWDSVVEARQRDDRVTGRIRLAPEFRGERDAWLAHPALVDVAIACAVALGERQESLYVPTGFDAAIRYSALPEAPIVRAARVGRADAEVLVVDLALTDDDGRVALQIDGLSLRPLAEPATLGDAGSVTSADHHYVAPLLALAVEHGIVAAEGVEMFERTLASGRPRLVASSIDLDDLRRIVIEPPEQPPATITMPAAQSGGVIGRIRHLWVELLGVTDIGDDDDFFDLGGHSLIAIRLMSRLHKELGIKFQLVTIFDAPTISALAALVRQARPELEAEIAGSIDPAAATTPARSESSAAAAPAPVQATPEQYRALVTISTEGSKQPLFIVHGAGGNVLFLWSLARAMAGDRPIFGFQARGVDGSDVPDPTIEDMAARYVAELRAAHRGPYLLGGYSGGGIVSFEMVRQLQALGEEVHLLVLFDSVPPGKAHPRPLKTVGHVLANIGRHGLSSMKPFLSFHSKRIARRFLPRGATRQDQEVSEEQEIGLDDGGGGFVNLYWYFTATAERYKVGTLDVDALVLKADWVWPTQPDDYHWRNHVRGDLDVAGVPGSHRTMFFPENAPRIARALTTILDRRGL